MLFSGPWPREVLKDIIDALAELHKLGIVHGDVEPKHAGQNKDGAGQIFDMDCARYIKQELDFPPSYMDFRGAPSFFGPASHLWQQARIACPHRADCYSTWQAACHQVYVS